MDAGALVYKGLLNPGYLPTSLGRILISLALAGAGGVLLASLTKSIDEKARRKLVRISCACRWGYGRSRCSRREARTSSSSARR